MASVQMIDLHVARPAMIFPLDRTQESETQDLEDWQLIGLSSDVRISPPAMNPAASHVTTPAEGNMCRREHKR